MPNYDSHPLRLLRRRFGLEMKELARLAGVSRATVSQIEEGRTRRPNRRVVEVLAGLSGVSVEELFERVVEWRGVDVGELLPRRALAVLALPADSVGELYKSFAVWRGEFSENPTHFASLLRVNRMTVAKYERGEFVGGLPDSLAHALVSRLGLSDEYVDAVAGLPVG